MPTHEEPKVSERAQPMIFLGALIFIGGVIVFALTGRDDE